jgi:hypothetical protein
MHYLYSISIKKGNRCQKWHFLIPGSQEYQSEKEKLKIKIKTQTSELYTV